jgi:hypothetical protein
MANGLFANIMTPEQAEAARQQRMLEQARLSSQLTPDQQGAMLGFQSGQRTGGLISDLMGFEPPEVKKARDFQTAVNKVQSRLSTEDLQDPAKVYTEMAKEASSLGYVQEAMQFATEAQKASKQERELVLRERQVANVGTTVKGVAVFRTPTGGLFVEEEGKQVTYDPKKHGRFETAQDRVAPRSLTRTVDRFGNITFTDPQTAEIVRTVPGAFSISGAPGAAPQTGQSAGQNVTTLDQLRQRLQQK